jgi:acyl carrier protein
MNTQEISQIAASVLYLDDAGKIETAKSLFKEYGMSSLDFVDFAYELKAAANKEFDPDQLWPINAMMNNPAFHAGGSWTDAGRAELARIFEGHTVAPSSGGTEELYGLFSVDYVEHRLRTL